MNPIDVVTQSLRAIFYAWLVLTVVDAIGGRWAMAGFCFGCALLVERFYLRGRE